MRKITAALATAALAATVVGPISAAGAQVIDGDQEISCDTVAPVLDPLVCDAEASLAPVEDAAAQVLAPAAPVLGEVEGAVAPAPAPASEQTAAPAPAPSSPAPSSTVGSTSSSAPTGFGGPVSVGGGSARSSSGRVPSVPAGSSLHLGSLGMPVFEVVSPAAAAKAAERTISDVVLPAATAAAADAMPQGGFAMAVLGAISALLMAAGLHLDHRRKTHHVIPG